VGTLLKENDEAARSRDGKAGKEKGRRRRRKKEGQREREREGERRGARASGGEILCQRSWTPS